MGADTTSTHLVFFIAATVIATATAGIFAGIVTDISGKALMRGESLGSQIAAEIRIINDPAKVPNTPNTIFYVKNIGSVRLDAHNMTVLIDGTLADVTVALLNGEATFRPGAIAKATYSSNLAAGDHVVQIVMENGVTDSMRFRI